MPRFQLPPFETEDPNEQLQLIKEATQRHGVGSQHYSWMSQMLKPGFHFSSQPHFTFIWLFCVNNIVLTILWLVNQRKFLEENVQVQNLHLHCRCYFQLNLLQVRAKLRGDEMWQPDEPQVVFFIFCRFFLLADFFIGRFLIRLIKFSPR